jgi:hypothetical protein
MTAEELVVVGAAVALILAPRPLEGRLADSDSEAFHPPPLRRSKVISRC